VTTHRFTIVPAGQLSFTVGAASAGGKVKAAEAALREIVVLLQPPSGPLSVKTITQLLHQKGFKFHENTVRSSVTLGCQRGELKSSGPHNSPTYSVP
jgi:hypothetical protein